MSKHFLNCILLSAATLLLQRVARQSEIERPHPRILWTTEDTTMNASRQRLFTSGVLFVRVFGAFLAATSGTARASPAIRAPLRADPGSPSNGASLVRGGVCGRLQLRETGSRTIRLQCRTILLVRRLRLPSHRDIELT
jgi:hypothetical protein